MSNLIVPNVGKRRIVGRITNAYDQVATKIKLFQNNYTPVAGTDLANLTEATFSNYTEKTLTTPTLAAGLDGSNRAYVTWDAVTWTKTGATGNTIYGYYVVNGSGELLWAERFDASVALTVDGQFITIQPKYTEASQFSNT